MARQEVHQPAPDPEWRADPAGELLRQHGLCGHQGCTHRLRDTFWMAWAFEYRREPGFSVSACSRRCIWNWWDAYRKAVRAGFWGPRRPVVKKIGGVQWSWPSRKPRETQRAQPSQQPQEKVATCKCQGGTLPCSSGICPRRPAYTEGQRRSMAGDVRIAARGPVEGPPALGVARPRSVALAKEYKAPGSEIELRNK